MGVFVNLPSDPTQNVKELHKFNNKYPIEASVDIELKYLEFPLNIPPQAVSCVLDLALTVEIN